jgi:multicomponent Na+:H+ antiporter subunit G
METLTQLLAVLVILIGTAFSVIGMVGFLRLPDVYTRLHATGKVSTFGVVLLLVAAALLTPVGWAKAVLLIAIVLIAGPVVSHAIGSAAYRVGIPMKQITRDDLARDVKS